MNKKELVIEKARDLFGQYGYKKVSMDEIAKEAGVTKKTIYSYFKDKDSMFIYFINEELLKLKEKIEKKDSENITLSEKISSNIYEMLLFRKNSNLISNIIKEIKNGNSEQGKEFLKIFDDEIINHIEEIIKKEISNGSIKKCDTHLTAFIVYKIFLSLLFEYDEKIDEIKVTQEVSNFLKEGLFN